MAFFRFLIRSHPILSSVFGLAMLGLVAFSVGFLREAMYFNDPAHRNQSLEGWMTPGYVGKSWDLPPPMVRDTLQLDATMKPNGRPMMLSEIAALHGVTLADLQSRVEAARASLDQQRNRDAGSPPENDEAKP